MKNPLNVLINLCLAICLPVLFYGCSTQENNAANRRLQNLSARYNYIYNANIILNDYQENLSQLYPDNYNQILDIYIAPPAIDIRQNIAQDAKELDEITEKARAIISEKSLSNYTDDAYMLLGKTSFYQGRYYNAAEYFDYVERAFRADKKVYLSALNWKARTYIQLNEPKMAEKILESVKKTIDSIKHGKAESLATLAQMSIYSHNFKQAISYLKAAIKASHTKESRTRWAFILGQLHELNADYAASLKSYTKVEHSNAPFEMYFNARLGKIRVNDKAGNLKTNRKVALSKLIKDDKNLDFTDQIYFEIAADYEQGGDFKNAETNYKLAVSKSTVNTNRKGLAYLKLADLYFKNLNDYVQAKLYYDSALQALPQTYPGYTQVALKVENLEYLSKRYQLINAQDSLQYFAKLSPEERREQISRKFTAPVTAGTTTPAKENADYSRTSDRNQRFYFSNLAAISRGFNDFRKKWGNRPLENNWRQSVKQSIARQQQASTPGNQGNTETTARDDEGINSTEAKINAYTLLLPLSEGQLEASNRQIIQAYTEIARFYQQELKDDKEAIKAYETLIKRFPQNNYLASVYYSLYLAYMSVDATKSDNYKNLVLKQYPQSDYARNILDPGFSSRVSALEAEINKRYNEVFGLYEGKKYKELINEVDEINRRFPGNKLQVQFDYLKAIAIGKTEPVDKLLTALQHISTSYPADSLITPLVKDHLAYIQGNMAQFASRKIALIDFNENESRFVAQQPVTSPTVLPTTPLTGTQATTPPATAINSAISPATIVATTPPVTTATVAQAPPPVTAPVISPPAQATAIPPANTPASPVPTVANTPAIKPEELFNKAASNSYYFVISVSNMEVSLSSSRFGIGQFNRGNYADQNLKHQLLDLDNDQVIYVESFATLPEITAYHDEISKQLNKIMKVPANQYKSFYISKENFEKIKDSATLNRYFEFFKTNFK